MSFSTYIKRDADGNHHIRIGDKFPVTYVMDKDNVIHKVVGESFVRVNDEEHAKKPWLKRAMVNAIKYEARSGLYQVQQAKTQQYRKYRGV